MTEELRQQEDVEETKTLWQKYPETRIKDRNEAVEKIVENCKNQLEVINAMETIIWSHVEGLTDDKEFEKKLNKILSEAFAAARTDMRE